MGGQSDNPNQDGAAQDATMEVDIDPREFRTVLGHFPTGVTVVTAVDDDGAHGLAIGSFFSVSLDPPLIGFCVGRDSTSWKRIEPSGRFAVNVLSEHQSELSNAFASSGMDKFSGVAWEPAPVTGSPLLADAVAHLDCDLETIHPGGDHLIVLGRVRHMQVHRGEHGPLIFFKGSYGRHEKL